MMMLTILPFAATVALASYFYVPIKHNFKALLPYTQKTTPQTPLPQSLWIYGSRSIYNPNIRRFKTTQPYITSNIKCTVLPTRAGLCEAYIDETQVGEVSFCFETYGRRTNIERIDNFSNYVSPRHKASLPRYRNVGLVLLLSVYQLSKRYGYNETVYVLPESYGASRYYLSNGFSGDPDAMMLFLDKTGKEQFEKLSKAMLQSELR